LDLLPPSRSAVSLSSKVEKEEDRRRVAVAEVALGLVLYL